MDYKQNLETTHTVVSQYNGYISNKFHYEEPTDKVIVLRNIFGPHNSKIKVRPIKHKLTGELLGVKRLSAEELRQQAYPITKDTVLWIGEGTTFNLMDETDRLNWNWVQYTDQVSDTREQCLKSPMSMLYVEDSERDLKKKMSGEDLLFQAELLVRKEWNDPQRMNYARLLGQDMSLHKPEEVLDYLVSLARSNTTMAQAIIDISKDNLSSVRLKLYRYKDVGIITEKNKSYWYESIRMGIDEQAAVGWMLHADNKDIVDQMGAAYAKLQRPNLSGHVDAPVRGTSVNPPQSPISSVGFNPNEETMSWARFAQLAPQTAQHLQNTLNQAQLAYFIDSTTSDELRAMIKKEMLNVVTPPATPVPEPALRPVLQFDEPGINVGGRGEQVAFGAQLVDYNDDDDGPKIFVRAKTATNGMENTPEDVKRDTVESVAPQTATTATPEKPPGEVVSSVYDNPATAIVSIPPTPANAAPVPTAPAASAQPLSAAAVRAAQKAAKKNEPKTPDTDAAAV